MDLEDLQAEIKSILYPEPDPELPGRDIPHSRLTDLYRLDTSYLESFSWEGSTMHPRTRLCPSDADRVHALTRNSDVPIRLFESSLRLLGDSIIAYHGREDRKGDLRYYPPIILTFWSGFETFIRHSFELMLATTREIPSAIGEFLQETETVVHSRGTLAPRSRNRPVLDRYAVLLKYAYRYEVDRGAKHWQRLQAAQDLRDYYTHLDVTNPRSVATSQVIDFIESVLLGIIWPSCEIGRTQLLGTFNVYWTWDGLRHLAEEYIEQPLLKEWPLGDEEYHFYCPFENVDSSRFPNMDEILKRRLPHQESGNEL